MTNEELLSVAEIVEKLTDRFNAQAALHRERFDEHVKLIASMKADHETKMAEHRAAFGARTEADAKIIAGLREELEGVGKGEGIRKSAERLVQERDALRAEVDAAWESATSASQSRSVAFPVRLDSNCEPCDPPNHDTEAGKAAAEAVVRESRSGEILVGDLVEVFQDTCPRWTTKDDVGLIGRVIRMMNRADNITVVTIKSNGTETVALADVRKVTT